MMTQTQMKNEALFNIKMGPGRESDVNADAETVLLTHNVWVENGEMVFFHRSDPGYPHAKVTPEFGYDGILRVTASFVSAYSAYPAAVFETAAVLRAMRNAAARRAEEGEGN